MKPTVSVIIPFYNKVNWLEEALESVFNQTYNVYEIIVINDGSNEDTTILKKYENKIIYISKINEGAASARNVGIELAKGEYIAFLDSDDIWSPKKLEIQLGKMIETGAVWSHTSYETFNDLNRKERNLKNSGKFNGNIYPRILASCTIATPCVIIKSEIIKNDKNLRFNKTMKYGEDLFLWLNLSKKYDLLGIDDVLTEVRIRGNNAAYRARVQIKARADIWRYIERNNKIYSKNQLSFPLIFNYRIIQFINLIIKYLEKKIKNKNIIEFIAKLLYLPSWLIFKNISKKYK